MSKIVIAFSIIFLLSAQTTAASKHPQLRYISLDAGLNMAGIRSSDRYDNHAKKFGPALRISGNYSFSDSRSIGASLAFERKGSVDPVHDIKTNLGYLTLPVYFKFVTGKDPRLFFVSGVYASKLLFAGRRGEHYIDGQLTAVNETVTHEFSSFDFGLTAGGGIMVKLYEDFDFLVSGNLSAGLVNIAKYSGQNPKNYTITISIGYIYYIGFR